MNKSFRKSMSKALVMTVVATTIATNGLQTKAATNPENNNNKTTISDKDMIAAFKSSLKKNTAAKVQAENPYEIVRVIVEVSGKSAADMAGSGKATADQVLAVKNSTQDLRTEAEHKTGGTVRNIYGNLFKGFSMEVQRGQIDTLKSMAGVISVEEAVQYSVPKLPDDKDLTGVYSEWNQFGYKGKGTVVAVIDTGVDYNHKAMRLSTSEGAKLTEEKVRELIKSGALKAGKNWDDKTKIKGYYNEKVPFGFNYADDNEEIRDKEIDGSMHGMHVAGIVAANSTDEDFNELKGMRGVAPEAQVLAMKVFSNASGGASGDDTVAAIEDAVLLGADVINLSLGSKAGFTDNDSPQQKAINKAVEKGVIVVVAAGNDGYSTYGKQDPNVNDIGIVGSPATAKESLAVANYLNSNWTYPAIALMDENGKPLKDANGNEIRSAYIAYDEAFTLPKGTIIDDLVDCGYGSKEEVEAVKGKLEGKTAFVKRGPVGAGAINFVEKIMNVKNAGAKNIVIWNHEVGKDGLLGIAGSPDFGTMKSVTMGNTAGTIVQKMLAEGKKFKLNVGYGYAMIPASSSNNFSDSTSWGCTPDLGLKPEIAAPGTQIFSTLNDDVFANMSGTSMASPHIAGAMAVVKEKINKEVKGLSGKELVDFAKKSLVNTAKPQYENPLTAEEVGTSRPFSPRRQGAGMLSLNDAIRNRVLVNYKGRPVVELREIKDTTVKFTIDLENYGSKDAEYNLSLENGAVLTNYVISGQLKYAPQPFDITLKPEQANVTFNNNKVVVPANGKATVEVSLNIGDNLTQERFLEGFVKLTSTNIEQNPNLGIPFMGYYGDWGKERIINNWAWETDPTQLTGLSKTNPGLRSVLATRVLNPETNKEVVIALGGGDGKGNLIDAVISPNADGSRDTMLPALVLLRNAKYIKAELIKDGKSLGEIAYTEGARKNKFMEPEKEIKPLLINNLEWDGTYYDSKAGKNVVAPDGKYEIKYSCFVDLPNAKPQEYVVPISVDTVAPSINIVSARQTKTKEYKVQWTSKDNSKIAGFGVFVNGKIVPDAKVETDAVTGISSTVVTLVEGQQNEVAVASFDIGDNFSIVRQLVEFGEIDTNVIIDGVPGASVTLNENSFKDGVYTLKGRVTKEVGSLTFQGKEIKVNDDYTFTYDIFMKDLKQGVNYYRVKALNKDGSVAKINDLYGDYAINVYFDSEAPILNLLAPKVGPDNTIVTTNNYIDVEGQVAESGREFTFYINGKVIKQLYTQSNFGTDVLKYDFKERVAVTDGDKVELKVVDGAGHQTVRVINVKVTKGPKVEFVGVEEGKSYQSVTPKVTVDAGATVTATLNGKAFRLGTVITREGSYTLTVIAKDSMGVETKKEVRFTIDKTAAVINVTGVQNGKTYNTAVTPVVTSNEKTEIKATLNGAAYTLGTAIKEDGNYVLEVQVKDEAGNVSKMSVKFQIKTKADLPVVTGINKGGFYKDSVRPNVRAASGTKIEMWLDGKLFSNGTRITQEGAHELLIKVTDALGNTNQDVYAFTIDKTAPVITVNGVENGGSYAGAVTPTITVSNDEKCTVSATLKNSKDRRENAYTLGTAITADGSYTLKITVKDAAGNTTTKTISFTIKAGGPVVTPPAAKPSENDVKKPVNPIFSGIKRL